MVECFAVQIAGKNGPDLVEFLKAANIALQFSPKHKFAGYQSKIVHGDCFFGLVSSSMKLGLRLVLTQIYAKDNAYSTVTQGNLTPKMAQLEIITGCEIG